jgi:glycosyl-4,4'-diaponeurosporenoate acyltransferase
VAGQDRAGAPQGGLAVRIIYLPRFWTIVVDCIAWALIQPGIAYLSLRFPSPWLDHRRWLFRSRPWEQEGKIYQNLFLVRRWKHLLPAGGTLFEDGFPMAEIQSRDPGYLARWVTETCRAELCHWLAILPAGLFFLWNPVWLGMVMVLYAVLFNAIPILTQRHNRPRLLAILNRWQQRKARGPTRQGQ